MDIVRKSNINKEVVEGFCKEFGIINLLAVKLQHNVGGLVLGPGHDLEPPPPLL